MMSRKLGSTVAVSAGAFARCAEKHANPAAHLAKYSGYLRRKARSNAMSDIIEVSEHENGQRIEMNPQQTLRVTLPEVRTAGFRWNLRAPSQHILVRLGDELDSTSSATGGAAPHHWDFRAAAVGTTELVFEYDRPWARAAAAARTFTVSVRVAEAASDAAGQSD
jgi:predicted secreted protein